MTANRVSFVRKVNMFSYVGVLRNEHAFLVSQNVSMRKMYFQHS